VVNFNKLPVAVCCQ